MLWNILSFILVGALIKYHSELLREISSIRKHFKTTNSMNIDDYNRLDKLESEIDAMYDENARNLYRDIEKWGTGFIRMLIPSVNM